MTREQLIAVIRAELDRQRGWLPGVLDEVIYYDNNIDLGQLADAVIKRLPPHFDFRGAVLVPSRNP